jgi:hypothetical protein
MSEDTCDEVLPIRPRVLCLKVRHVETPGGTHTIIARKVESPDLCRRCVGVPCNHDGGFCVVVAPERVRPELCAGYVLHARPDERAPGLGVEGG